MMSQTDLICEATRVAGDEGTALYEFELQRRGRELDERPRDRGARCRGPRGWPA